MLQCKEIPLQIISEDYSQQFSKNIRPILLLKQIIYPFASCFDHKISKYVSC